MKIQPYFEESLLAKGLSKINTLKRNPITLIFIMELYKMHVSFIFLPNYLCMEIFIFLIGKRREPWGGGGGNLFCNFESGKNVFVINLLNVNI